jgi:metal-responsive CopG/Arc/MetJ family transcriptional regulator
MVDKSDTKIYRILVNLTHAQISELDAIVKSKEYPSRSEAIREAVKMLLETKKLEKLKEKLG